MRKLAILAGCATGLLLVAYAAGLGVYAVASTRPWVTTQPRTPDEARRVLARLELASEYPFQSRLLLTPHGRMHYVDLGQGPAVLCLHGNGRWSLEYGPLKAGETLTVWMQFEANPTGAGHRDQSVQLLDGDEQLASVSRRVTVYP